MPALPKATPGSGSLDLIAGVATAAQSHQLCAGGAMSVSLAALLDSCVERHWTAQTLMVQPIHIT